MIRISVPRHPDEVQQYYSEVWSFRKVYDATAKLLRIDAYPVNDPDWTPDYLRDVEDGEQFVMGGRRYKRPTNAFVMLAHGDQVYVVEEEESDRPDAEASVECRKMNIKWRPMDPLKKALYETLTFEHNHLCYKYTNLNFQESQRCKVDYSSLYVDAFTHHPIELFLEARVRRRYGGGDDDDESTAPETHEMKVYITSIIQEFEFGVDQKEKKELFTMPEELKRICREEDITDSRSINPAWAAVLSMDGIDVE